MNTEEKKHVYSFKLYEVIVMIIATCLLSFFAGSSIMELRMNRNDKKTDKYTDLILEDDELKDFIDNYIFVLENYYKDIDSSELINGAISGMMSKLEDPYTIYMENEKYDTFNITLNGQYRGIGVEIAKYRSNNDIVIVGVLSDSPASKAGLVAGDIIKTVNGVEAKNYSTTEISNMILNSKDKKFTFEIERNNEIKTFIVSKDDIKIESVVSKVFEQNDHKIGYIYISIFAINTATQFASTLNDLEKEGIDSLIIDVRSNTGGHLSSAAAMASLFVDKKHTIYKIKKNDEITAYKSTGKKTKKYPIVVLTNSASASASELLTGCLKDNLNATIIGTKTYGKGTVQELISLKNGDQYKITTKEWLTPNGNKVNGVGIEPDIEVKLTSDYLLNPSDETDNQLQAAINHLSK